jgi:hypothetical protein
MNRSHVAFRTKAASRRAATEGSRLARTRCAALAAALGALALSAPARAELVVRDEAVGCSLDCQDSFEVRCTEKAAAICVTVRGQTSGPVQFESIGIGLAPDPFLGDAAKIITGAQTARTFCLQRPGGPGTMKALVEVNALGPQAGYSYQLSAGCYVGLSSKRTIVTREQNE